MLKKLNKSNEGFTIIEVLIVLAIAGLIILIVFLAVPALQRNSRNTGVRNDSARVAGLVQETANNNNGTLTVGTTTPTNIDPANANYGRITAVNYNVHATAFQNLATPLARDTVYIRNWSTCAAGSGGQVGVAAGGTLRSVSVTYLVESPGATATAGAGGNPAGFVAQCVTGN